MPRRAVLKGGPCDGLVRVVQADVFVVPLMPEMPGVWDPETGGFRVEAHEAMTPISPFAEARYRVTGEFSEGCAVYRYEGT